MSGAAIRAGATGEFCVGCLARAAAWESAVNRPSEVGPPSFTPNPHDPAGCGGAVRGSVSHVEPIAQVRRNVGREFGPAADLLLCCAAKKKARKRAPPPRPCGLPSLRVRRAGSAQTRPTGSDMRSPVSARRTLQSARQRGPSVSPRNRGLAEGRSVSLAAGARSPPRPSEPRQSA